MADITLTAATRSNLLTAQRTDELSARSDRRLATGQRVNKPSDQSITYFLAKALSDQAGDLLAVKDNIGQSLSLVGGATDDVKYLTQLINQLKAIATGATDQSPQTRAQQAAQFDAIRAQLDSLAADSGFGGTNLLGASPDSQSVLFNQGGSSSLTIAGRASDSASLGIGTAQGAYNNFATDADVQSAVFGLDQAFQALRTTARTLGSNASTLNTRLDFTESLANTLQGGAARLTGADMNEEAANALALNISRQLSVTGLNFVNASQQAIQQLF
ncbi:MAG: flagellin [Proteobacteria bacterium]|nr:flagellin [Pseudomonadota bacterium]